MEKAVFVLLLAYSVSAGFIDRLNELYSRWSPNSGQHAFDRQNYVTADQLLPDALLHQQILGPQLAAAGYSGAQIVAGPIAVPLKNLPRPPGVGIAQPPFPSYQEPGKQVHHTHQHHQPSYQQPQQHQQQQHHAQHVAHPQASPNQAVLHHHPQQPQYSPPAPSAHYQPPALFQPPAPQQYQPAPAPLKPALKYQPPTSPTQYQQQSYHQRPGSEIAPPQQTPVRQAYPSFGQAQPAPQYKNVAPAPQYLPQTAAQYEQKPVFQQHQQAHQNQYPQQTEAPQYRPAPVQQAVHSHQSQLIHRAPASSAEFAYQRPPVQPPKQPVYQHVQKSKTNDIAPIPNNYEQTRPIYQNVPAVEAASTNTLYHNGQVSNHEAIKHAAGDQEAPVRWQYSEWTPIPKGLGEASTVPTIHQGAVQQTNQQYDQQGAASDISDSDLQNLNFHNVFDGIVPDIPDIPANIDLSAFSAYNSYNASAIGNIDPSLLGLLANDPQALSHLKANSAQYAQFQAAQGTQALKARSDLFQDQASASNVKVEVEKLPAQGRSSEGPVRTSLDVKTDSAVKKDRFKQKTIVKTDSTKPVVKVEASKLKRRKTTDASGKIVIRTTTPVTTTSLPPKASTEATLASSTEAIITAAWKTEKPQAVPRIGEGSGRFVGRVLPGDDLDIVPAKSSAQLSDGIFVSNVGYSIKFTSRR